MDKSFICILELHKVRVCDPENDEDAVACPGADDDDNDVGKCGEYLMTLILAVLLPPS